MKKIEHKPESSCVSEPAMVYYRKPSKEMEFPDYIKEDIRISLEQIEKGQVIPFDEVWKKIK